jgi:cysteine desulfurase
MFRFRRDVYLDHNATTRPSRRVRKRMNRILDEVYGNPSSLHGAARLAASVLEDSRAQVAAAIGCSAAEVCFTGSASEANNTVLLGLAELFVPRKKKIVSTPIEHPSIMATLEHLRGRGLVVEYLPVDQGGHVKLERLEELVDADTFLVCCGLANNEIGTVQDVAALTGVAHRRGALVLSDCVQALGKIPVDVRMLGVDYASFSAHKIHGPKGVGALYIKEGSPFTPLVHGGSQESGRRAGTEGVHDLAGFAEACAGVGRLLAEADRVRLLRDGLVSELRALKPDLIVNSPAENALGNTTSITFPGVENAVLMAALDYHGIAVSAGSACHTQANEPSHVLKAIGLTDADARRTIRISAGSETTPRAVRHALAVFRDFFENKLPAIGVVSPAQLNEELLFRPETYILDVRFPYDRKLLKSLPNAHEASFFSFRELASLVPRDRHVIVVCQGGVGAPIVAYSLRAKGHPNVSFLLTGMAGWRLRQPALYEKYAGAGVVALGAAGSARGLPEGSRS